MPGRTLSVARIFTAVTCAVFSAGAGTGLSACSATGGAGPDNSTSTAREGTRPMLYVGGESGIKWYSLKTPEGTLEMKGGLDYAYAATYFAKSPDGKFFYSVLRTVSEPMAQMAGKAFEGYIASYSVDQTTGDLKEISRISSFGDRPTYLSIDKTGKFLICANNLGHLQGNSIVTFPIGSDGKLGQPVQRLMTGIRAHQVRISANNKYVYVPNIDSDFISQFAFDENTGGLTPLNPATAPDDPTGAVKQAFGATLAGSRHLDFHPNGKWIYLSNEYAATVVTYKVNDDGTLTQMAPAVSGVPADFALRRWQSEIRVTPNGKWVYAGERVHESIALFAVDQTTGVPKFMGNTPTMGKTPRHFTLDPSGKWLIAGNQESSSLVVFKINDADGSLTMTAGPIDQPTPYVHLFVTLP
jgi:6-phosphogluconolactonase